MVQVGEQEPTQVRPPWKPGQSGNPAGSRSRSRAAIQAKAEELSREFGGWSELGEADRGLLIKAAELLLRPTLRLDEESATRIANAVSRILNGLRRRHGVRPRQKAATPTTTPRTMR